MRIGIYKGYGASKIGQDLMRARFEEYGFSVYFIYPETICDHSTGWMDKTDILIFGGQSVTQFKQALGQTGLDNIQFYVQRGGHYLGICAGGYLGVNLIRFKGIDPQTGQIYTKQNNGLSFFNGLARGSITDISPHLFNGLADSAAIASLRTMTGEKFKALYWGGPTFIPYTRALNRKILSYLPRRDQSPLIMGLQNDVGNQGGRATLLGYHPEISRENIQRWILSFTRQDHPNKKIIRALQETPLEEFDRTFEMLLEQIGLRTPSLPQPVAHPQPGIFAS